MKRSEAKRGRDHPDTLSTVANLGVNYKDSGRIAEAIPLLEEAYLASKQYRKLDIFPAQLLDAYIKAADPAKPESITRVTALVQELLAAARTTIPKDSTELAAKLATFGTTLLALKAWDEAESLVREGITILGIPFGRLCVEAFQGDRERTLLRNIVYVGALAALLEIDMDTVGENPRGIHAGLVLENRKDFTLGSLIAAAYDTYLPAFARMVPALVAAYDSTPASDPVKTQLAEQIAVLRAWDHHWSVSSVPTSLAVFWGDELWRQTRGASRDERISVFDDLATSTPSEVKLRALAAASERLTNDFGSWRTPWGEINRFQRLTGEIVQRFTDAGPSIPVGFTSARWGSLASFRAQRYEGTKRYYGTSGNSFVAVVEFGDSVRAFAVTAGGESGHLESKHFNDQALRYSTGDLREVYFYPSQLQGHTERVYHPGE